MAQQTAVSGNRYAFADTSFEGETIAAQGGVLFRFPKGVVQAFNWDATQEVGVVQGNQIAPVGHTNGPATATATMDILVSEADDWMQTITTGGFYPVMSVYLNLRIGYSVNGTDSRTDQLNGMRLTKIGAPHQKGNDAIVRTLEFVVSQIYEAGLLIFGDPLAL